MDRSDNRQPDAELSLPSGTSESDREYPAGLVFIVDRKGKILFVTRTPAGLAEDDVIGTSIYSYTLRSQRRIVRACLQRVFATGKPDGYECAGAGPHSSDSWYQCRVLPHDREGDEVKTVAVHVRDITQWRRVETDLRKERDALRKELEERGGAPKQPGPADNGYRRDLLLERFRAAMDRAGEAIFITDRETGRFIDLNETACRWLRRSRDELLKLAIGDLDLEFPLQNSDADRPHVTETRDSRRPEIHSQGVHRRKNGTSFPVEVAIACQMIGEKEYVLAVAREISGRKRKEEALAESEEKYRDLFNLSRDAVYASARDGTVVDVNQAAIDLFGYTRDEFIGMEARKLYDHAGDIRKFQKGVKEQGSVRDLEVTFVTRQGKRIAGHLSATLRRAGSGEILGYQCLVRLVEPQLMPPQPSRPPRPASPPEEGVPPTPERQASDVEPHTKAEPTEEVPESESPRTPPHPTEEDVGSRTILVVEGKELARNNTQAILESAGFSVVTAEDASQAVEVLRAQSEEIGTVMLGSSTHFALAARDLQQIRASYPDITVVRLSREMHPLALVQQAREALRGQGEDLP